MSARPFLKWAGGKSQLLPELATRSPRRIDTYYEPFLGGGALFFALIEDPERAPRRAVLNDLNRDLISAYEAVRDTPDALIESLAALDAEYVAGDPDEREALFYAMRDERLATTPLEVAARLIFLNKTCYNGLYRVNRRGQFNVPFGRYKSPRILDRDGLAAASRALANVDLTSADFEEACAAAAPGDFVYLDPPFHPLSQTANFTAYTAHDFDHGEQIRLKRYIDALTARGVPVLLSNSPHPWIRGGYEFAGYCIAEVKARRAINSRGDGRGPIGELIVTNYDVATMTVGRDVRP